MRRDWCDLSRDMGSAVLDFILSGRPRDEVIFLKFVFFENVN